MDDSSSPVDGGDGLSQEGDRVISGVSETCVMLRVPAEDEEAEDISAEKLYFCFCLSTTFQIDIGLFLLFRHLNDI
jgi:hypothetical protein